MDKKFGHPEFYKLLEEMADLHSRKNHDYAGTKDPLKNLRSPVRLGISPFVGVLIRLQDKWSRLEEFINSGTFLVKDESVEDTLMDNAVYSLLAIILYREEIQAANKPTETIDGGLCEMCAEKMADAEQGDAVPLCNECSRTEFRFKKGLAP